jgi:hypothetical protein
MAVENLTAAVKKASHRSPSCLHSSAPIRSVESTPDMALTERNAAAVERILDQPLLHLTGLRRNIGSQVTDPPAAAKARSRRASSSVHAWAAASPSCVPAGLRPWYPSKGIHDAPLRLLGTAFSRWLNTSKLTVDSLNDRTAQSSVCPITSTAA